MFVTFNPMLGRVSVKLTAGVPLSAIRKSALPNDTLVAAGH
jgi:hypothetical protein